VTEVETAIERLGMVITCHGGRPGAPSDAGPPRRPPADGINKLRRQARIQYWAPRRAFARVG
jgi:hypothetical protein